MIPEIRDIILADERILRAGWIAEPKWHGVVTVWERGHFMFGETRFLDTYESVYGKTLSALVLVMEFPTPEGHFVQTLVTLPEYLIHGVDDNGGRRR